MRFFCFLIVLPFWVNGQEQHTSQASDTVYQKYKVLLKAYQEGRKDYSVMPYLAKTAKAFKDTALSREIGMDYVNNYLLKLNGEALYTKENIQFIRRYVTSSDNPGFTLFFKQAAKIDKVMGRKGYAAAQVDFVIAKEEIDPFFFENGKPVQGDPDWKKITKTIIDKYNRDYAERTVLNAMIRWAEYKKDSTELVRLNIRKMDKYGVDTAGMARMGLNNTIYYIIFKHSDDAADLKKAIKWMELVLNAEPGNPAYMDTYANLLYKIGRKKEAIEWERKAFAIDPNNPETKDAWEKMNKGIPTWNAK